MCQRSQNIHNQQGPGKTWQERSPLVCDSVQPTPLSNARGSIASNKTRWRGPTQDPLTTSNWKHHQGKECPMLLRWNSPSNALPSWEPWGSLTPLWPCFLNSFRYSLFLTRKSEGGTVHFKWVNCMECELCLNWNKHLRGAKRSSRQPDGNRQIPQQRMQQGDHGIKGENSVAFQKQECQIHTLCRYRSLRVYKEEEGKSLSRDGWQLPWWSQHCPETGPYLYGLRQILWVPLRSWGMRMLIPANKVHKRILRN